jgi:hypothetical protein
MARRQSQRGVFAALWRGAFRSVDRALDKARHDVDTPPSALIDAWIASHTHPALPLRPLRRAPASLADIERAQTRLGFALPPQLVELYRATAGLDWLPAAGEPMACGGHFPPLAQVVLAADLSPPLSLLGSDTGANIAPPVRRRANSDCTGRAPSRRFLPTPKCACRLPRSTPFSPCSCHPTVATL